MEGKMAVCVFRMAFAALARVLSGMHHLVTAAGSPCLMVTMLSVAWAGGPQSSSDPGPSSLSAINSAGESEKVRLERLAEGLDLSGAPGCAELLESVQKYDASINQVIPAGHEARTAATALDDAIVLALGRGSQAFAELREPARQSDPRCTRLATEIEALQRRLGLERIIIRTRSLHLQLLDRDGRFPRDERRPTWRALIPVDLPVTPLVILASEAIRVGPALGTGTQVQPLLLASQELGVWRSPREPEAPVPGKPTENDAAVASYLVDLLVGGGLVPPTRYASFVEDATVSHGNFMALAPGRTLQAARSAGADARAREQLLRDTHLQRLLSVVALEDALTGQLDRHWANLMVTQDARGGVTGLSAIDNDHAFGVIDPSFASRAPDPHWPGLPHRLDGYGALGVLAIQEADYRAVLGAVLKGDYLEVAVARLKAMKLFLDHHLRSFLLGPTDWRADTPEAGGAHSGYAGQFLKWNARMEKEAPAATAGPDAPSAEGRPESKDAAKP
jgi:hypothetical protein